MLVLASALSQSILARVGWACSRCDLSTAAHGEHAPRVATQMHAVYMLMTCLGYLQGVSGIVVAGCVSVAQLCTVPLTCIAHYLVTYARCVRRLLASKSAHAALID